MCTNARPVSCVRDKERTRGDRRVLSRQTENSLSRQMPQWFMLRQRFPCRDKACPFGVTTQPRGVATRLSWLGVLRSDARGKERLVSATECAARATSHPVRRQRAQCACDRPCDSALCCALFGSLFIDTVHKQCSWALLKKSTKITLVIQSVTVMKRKMESYFCNHAKNE